MKNSSVFKIISNYLYDNRKKRLIEKIKNNKFKHYYKNILIKDIDFLFRKDIDIIKILIDKYNIIFLNQYSESNKKEDFFLKALEHAKNKEDEWDMFGLLEIPEEPKFEKFQIIQKLLKKELVIYSELKEEYKSDPFILYECLKKDKSLVNGLNEEMLSLFKDNEKIGYEVIYKRGDWYKFFSEKVRAHKFIMAHAIIHDIENYKYIPEKCKQDKDLMLNVLSCNADIYPFISDIFKNDEDFIGKAVKKQIRLFQLIDKKFSDDFWISNIMNNHLIFEYAPENIRSMYSIALGVLEKEPLMYNFLSKKLKQKRDLALIGVKAIGGILSSLSKELRDDDEIVVEAVKNNSFAYPFASERLKKEKNLILKVIDEGSKENISLIFDHMDKSLLEDYDILLSMADFACLSVNNLTQDLIDNKILQKRVLENNPSEILNYISHYRIRGMQNMNENIDGEIEELIIEGIQTNPKTIKYIEKNLKDKSFYLTYQNIITLHRENLEDDYEILQGYKREESLRGALKEQDNIKNRIDVSVKRKKI